MPHRFIIRYPMPHRADRITPDGPQQPRDVFAPATDVFETPEGFRIRVEIAGVDPNEIEILVADDHRTLTIEGVRPPVPQEGPGRYLNIEIQHGPFARTIVLPDEVSGEEARAAYNHGYLVVSLPRLRPQAIRRSVPIQTD